MVFLKKILTLSPIYYFFSPVLIETWYPRLVPIQLSGAMTTLLFFGFLLYSSTDTWRKKAYIFLAIVTHEIFWFGLIYGLLTQGEVNAFLKWVFWIAVLLFFGLIFSARPWKEKETLENRQFKS